MTMSHTVYSVRGIEITNYSGYENATTCANYSDRQRLDYQAGSNGPEYCVGWGAAVTMVADASAWSSTRSVKAANFQATPREITTSFGLVEAGTVAQPGALYRRGR